MGYALRIQGFRVLRFRVLGFKVLGLRVSRADLLAVAAGRVRPLLRRLLLII